MICFFLLFLMQVVSSVKRATSISLTTDSATLPTGESFVAVTGHWIDRVPSENAGKSNWKLKSAVLALLVDNGNRFFSFCTVLCSSLFFRFSHC